MMKLRNFCLSSLIATIPLFLPHQAQASASFLADNIESFAQAPNSKLQTRQGLWGPNSLSSVPPVAPDTVLAANVADSDPRYTSCENDDVGTKNRKLRIRNEESCPADGGASNRPKLPSWATPWRTNTQEAVEEPDDRESCLAVIATTGMALPYHLCCLGIVRAYVNGMMDQISKCLFKYTECDPYMWYSQDVCCQTFSIELGSEYATGINCLPRA